MTTLTHIITHGTLVEKIVLGWAAFVALLIVWFLWSKFQANREAKQTRSVVYDAIRSGAKLPPEVLRAYPEYISLYKKMQASR